MDGLVIQKKTIVLSFWEKKLYFHSDRKKKYSGVKKKKDPPGYEMGGPLRELDLITF